MQQHIKVVSTRKFDSSNKIPNVTTNIPNMQYTHGAMLENSLEELQYKSSIPILDIVDIKTVELSNEIISYIYYTV